VRCRRRYIEVWRSGAREACCTCGDVEEEETQRYQTLEMRCRRVDVDTLEIWSSGGVLERVVMWRRHRGSELWGGAAAVEKLEIWSSGGTLQALPQKSYGALAYCSLLLEFLAFVPQGPGAKRSRFPSPVLASSSVPFDANSTSRIGYPG